MTVVAVMQPYFFPYAGYYRLLAAADVFVAFDCVQFPRRGWVHRNKLPDHQGTLDWLTLPLEKAPYDALIRDLRFADDAETAFRHRASAFPSLKAALVRNDDPLIGAVLDFTGAAGDYLERTLKATCARLGFAPEFRRSSRFDIDPALRGQDRVLALAKANGANRYVNLSGGADIYDPDFFANAGIELQVLEPYAGAMASMLHRVLTEDPSNIKAEIAANLRFLRR